MYDIQSKIFFLTCCEEVATRGWKQSRLDHLIIRLVCSLVGRVQYHRENKEMNSYVNSQMNSYQWFWKNAMIRNVLLLLLNLWTIVFTLLRNQNAKCFLNAKPYFNFFLNMSLLFFDPLLPQLLTRERLN